MTSLNAENAPQHIAIVMDGNGRWAKQRKKSVSYGHKAGAENVRVVLSAAKELGVKELTLFAFSSENWQRPRLEVSALMTLFSDYLDNHIDELDEEGVRLRFIGSRERFSKGLLAKIKQAEKKTQANQLFVLNLAVDYGGQWDICQATKIIAQKVLNEEIMPDQVDESLLEKYLSLDASRYPDLLIRTSGECRISNFLLWQLAYSELYFTDVLWPDFSASELVKAVTCFQQRDRRYGTRTA